MLTAAVRATEGLQKEFGEDRVFDIPLAESGIGGLALGLGLQGFRPVMEIQFFGFVYEVMDSVSGQMARMRYRSGGRWNSPVTIRSPFGGGVQMNFTRTAWKDSLHSSLDLKSLFLQLRTMLKDFNLCDPR